MLYETVTSMTVRTIAGTPLEFFFFFLLTAVCNCTCARYTLQPRLFTRTVSQRFK